MLVQGNGRSEVQPVGEAEVESQGDPHAGPLNVGSDRAQVHGKGLAGRLVHRRFVASQGGEETGADQVGGEVDPQVLIFLYLAPRKTTGSEARRVAREQRRHLEPERATRDQGGVRFLPGGP